MSSLSCCVCIYLSFFSVAGRLVFGVKVDLSHRWAEKNKPDVCPKMYPSIHYLWPLLSILWGQGDFAQANPTCFRARAGNTWTSHQSSSQVADTACKVPTAHQEQFGVRYPSQGHFDMQLSSAGAGIWTSDLPITSLLALPAELQPPRLICENTRLVFFCHLLIIFSSLRHPSYTNYMTLMTAHNSKHVSSDAM